jgi:hypothetical protein
VITDQVSFTADELLADDAFAEPLVANGVRCHGGFDENGNYLSPRTRFRKPAIVAWEAKRADDFGTAPLEAPIDTWPEHFPNVAQSKLLVRNGITEMAATELTRIGTVESFGAMLRHQPLPDFQVIFDDSIEGTATEHIRKGLFEAHSRDEAGWEEEAGHDQMWFAARDIAFEGYGQTDMRAQMLERMGITGGGGTPPDFAKLRAEAIARRVLPGDIDFDFESMLNRMISLLFIEISAFHAFAWAEELLSDEDLVAGEGEAARIVSYIRQDEMPHVGYLTAALSEMRDRTWVGSNGTKYDGNEMIQRLWDRAMSESLFSRRHEFLKMTQKEVERVVGHRPNRDDLLQEFWSLGNVQPQADGGWIERRANGEEIRISAA